MVCKKGFYLNGDYQCDSLTPFNCESLKYQPVYDFLDSIDSYYGNTFALAVYLIADGVGC